MSEKESTRKHEDGIEVLVNDLDPIECVSRTDRDMSRSNNQIVKINELL